MKTGACLILAGPSAVGKTTVAGRIAEDFPVFTFLRSMTTRPPRTPSDTEYFYVTDDGFDRAVRDGEFLEYATYGAYRYGTPRAEVARAGREGKYPLLVLDRQGVRSLRQADGVAPFAVYLYDTPDVLEKRLYERELKESLSVEAFLTYERRRQKNLREYGELPSEPELFDMYLENRTPEDTARQVAEAFFSFVDDAFVPSADRAAVTAYLCDTAREREARPFRP